MASSIYSFSPAISNQKPRGISKVYVKHSGDTGYSSLGDIRNGKASVKSLSSKNTYMRSQPFAYVCDYSFEMKQTTTAEISLLIELLSGAENIIIQCVDGQCYVHNTASTLLGIQFEFKADGKIDKDRFVVVEMKVGVFDSDLATVMPSSAPSITAPGTSDLYYSIANTNPAVDNIGKPSNIRPSGVSKLEICALSESSYDDVGEVTNSTISIKCFGNETDKLRYRTVGASISCSFDLMQDSSTEKANLNLFRTSGAKLKVTFFDGVILTLSSIGINFEEKNDGDFDGHKYINLSCDGNVLISDFSGLFS